MENKNMINVVLDFLNRMGIYNLLTGLNVVFIT